MFGQDYQLSKRAYREEGRLEPKSSFVLKFHFAVYRIMKDELDVTEIAEEIEAQLAGLKEKVGISKKLKGRNRIQYIQSVRDKDWKRIKTYINHLQSSINYNEDSLDHYTIQERREQVQKYKASLEKLIKKLESSKNEELTQEVIFEERAAEAKVEDADGLICAIDEAQKNSQEAVRRALRNLYQMQGIGREVNVQLQRQINQLDSIYTTLQDTESSMNRAIRYINYFARSVYTDKMLMALIVLIVIAIVAIIVLSAMGKIPSGSQDTLP